MKARQRACTRGVVIIEAVMRAPPAWSVLVKVTGPKGTLQIALPLCTTVKLSGVPSGFGLLG